MLIRENAKASKRLEYLSPGGKEKFYRSLTSEQIPKVRVVFAGEERER